VLAPLSPLLRTGACCHAYHLSLGLRVLLNQEVRCPDTGVATDAGFVAPLGLWAATLPRVRPKAPLARTRRRSPACAGPEDPAHRGTATHSYRPEASEGGVVSAFTSKTASEEVASR
jgi:hypothetical protein